MLAALVAYPVSLFDGRGRHEHNVKQLSASRPWARLFCPVAALIEAEISLRNALETEISFDYHSMDYMPQDLWSEEAGAVCPKHGGRQGMDITIRRLEAIELAMTTEE